MNAHRALSLLAGLGLGVGLALSIGPAGAAETPTGTWLAPAPLGLGREPVVAASAGGDVVAAWRSVENGGVVRASFRPAGGRWQPVVEWPGFVLGPRVAIDRQGTAIVVWIAYRDDLATVAASIRPVGRRWETPVHLSSQGEWATDPRVGMDAAGNAFVAWRSSMWPESIQTRYLSAATGTWAPAVSVASYAYSQLDLSVSPGGQALLVWDVSFDVGYGVAATVGAGGRWEQPAVVGRSREGADYFTKPREIAAAIGDRTAAIAWQYGVHGNGIIEATVRPSGGAWEAPVDLSFTDGQAFLPALAVDEAGTVLTAWDANVDIEGSTRRAGAPSWDRPVVVSPSTGAPVLHKSARGDAVALWSSGSSSSEVRAARKPAASATWRATSEIAVPAGRIGGVGVAIDAAGDAIAIWERNDGRWWVEVAASDVAPPVVTKLVAPRSGAVRTALRFTVSALDTWSRTVVPTWTFGDGSKGRGSSVTHRYRAPGRYRVTVTVADVLGHATTTSRTIRVRR